MASLADFMEATARSQKGELPGGYGYQVDVELGVGFFKDERSGCKVLEKPITIPSGQDMYQGYVMLYSYCCYDGMTLALEGGLPPVLPATMKEPREFQSLAEIANNFGAKDPQKSSDKSKYCIPFRVPVDLAAQADTPGRNLWIIRFDQDVVSPFLQAVKEGSSDKVLAGLRQGISGNTVDENGVTALMMAAMAGSKATCRALIDNGADVNKAEPTNKRTALMFAAQKQGGLEAAKVLLDSKADASKVDSEGATALMWAAVANNAEAVKLLLQSSNKDIRNNDGQTAQALAEKMGHKDCAALLK